MRSRRSPAGGWTSMRSSETPTSDGLPGIIEAKTRRFWHEAFALKGTITLVVMSRVLAFGALAGLVYLRTT